MEYDICFEKFDLKIFDTKLPVELIKKKKQENYDSVKLLTVKFVKLNKKPLKRLLTFRNKCLNEYNRNFI
jgi:hypothetical protein